MVYALRDIKQGEHIVWHYGYKGNHELLQDYGFIIDDGSMPEEVEVVFEFEVNIDDDLYQEKSQALGEGQGLVNYLLDSKLDSKSKLFDVLSNYRIILTEDKKQLSKKIEIDEKAE